MRVLGYLWRSVEGVSVENRLDHDEGLSQVLPVEMMSVVRALIWTVVEHLQEWRTAQVEHELQKREVCLVDAFDEPQVYLGVSGQRVEEKR